MSGKRWPSEVVSFVSVLVVLALLVDLTVVVAVGSSEFRWGEEEGNRKDANHSCPVGSSIIGYQTVGVITERTPMVIFDLSGEIAANRCLQCRSARH